MNSILEPGNITNSNISKLENSKELIRLYSILSAQIITEYSSVLTDSQLSEEQTLKRELFNLLRQKGVRL